MENTIIHVPHSSLFIPDEYRKTALISQEELEEENRLMCDTGIVDVLPPDMSDRTIIFPYSRLYCDVERFRDGSEKMESYGMGYIYTKDSWGREIFRPTEEHRREVDRIYEQHQEKLNSKVTEILEKCGSCVIIDLHSYSDEVVERLFGYRDCPDICIGTEPGFEAEDLVGVITRFCQCMGLRTGINYPFSGSMVPDRYYGQKDTAIASVMIEINKRILEKYKMSPFMRPHTVS